MGAAPAGTRGAASDHVISDEACTNGHYTRLPQPATLAASQDLSPRQAMVRLAVAQLASPHEPAATGEDVLEFVPSFQPPSRRFPIGRIVPRVWLPFVFVTLSCGANASTRGTTRDAAPTTDGHVLFEASTGDVSEPLCDQYPVDGGAAISFGVIQTVFTEHCTSCHSSEIDAAVAGAADLDLSAGHAWANLVGRQAPASESCGGTLVVPGDPGGSYLYQKLTSDRPCSGERMPRGDAALPLPDCVIALVRAWIVEGANASSGS